MSIAGCEIACATLVIIATIASVYTIACSGADSDSAYCAMSRSAESVRASDCLCPLHASIISCRSRVEAPHMIEIIYSRYAGHATRVRRDARVRGMGGQNLWRISPRNHARDRVQIFAQLMPRTENYERKKTTAG